MNAQAVIFPFDTFGSAGCGAGAQMLGDVLREALDDTAAESRRTRPHAYADKLTIDEVAFDTMESLADWRNLGRQAIAPLLKKPTFTLWLAGNHLGVLPVYDLLGASDLVLQFDAHLDCYDLHDTTQTLSHGNFLRHITAPRPKIVTIGHRDLFLRSEDQTPYFAETIPIEDVAADFALVKRRIDRHITRAKRIWLDLDADVFDPCVAPGVPQPQPFGLMPQPFLAMLDAVWSKKIVGLSMSEFDPGRDVSDQTLQLLAWLLERVLLKWAEG